MNPKKGYLQTIDSRNKFGYSDWTIFDNFGEVVTRTSDISIVYQLINYYDKLAGHHKDSDLLDRVLKDYLN